MIKGTAKRISEMAKYDPRDFEFIVGDRRFMCKVREVEYIWPKIEAIRRVDPTYCSYNLQTMGMAP